MERIDITGQRFGRWTVQGWAGTKWRCLCDCGATNEVGGYQLREGLSLSCGCLRKEQLTRHGHARKRNRTPTYKTWYAMIQRCTNPKTKQFKDYGGRGIKVCDEWLSFDAFLRDMVECPAGNSLDRIDNDAGYSKENCRWTTRAEQQRNQRRTRWLTVDGVTKTLPEWARERGLYTSLVRNRIVKSGWTVERALGMTVS